MRLNFPEVFQKAGKEKMQPPSLGHSHRVSSARLETTDDNQMIISMGYLQGGFWDILQVTS
jgi:hypothetical protein